jgi:heme exporter protein D
MALEEFFHMGGYAIYVWSSYGMAFVIMLLIFIQPMMSRKQLRKDLQMKYRQQEKQNHKHQGASD